MNIRERWAIPALVGAAAALCFLPVLGNDFVLWDDDLNLTDNPSYRGFSWRHLRWMLTTVHGGHYQPLSWATFALDYTLWGLDPTGYHLTNLLLHAVSAVLCYLLVLALLRRAFEPVRAAALPRLHLAAAAGALFFAIHPLRVESVAWASERRDVQSGVFYLGTLLSYVRMTEVGGTAAARRWYLASLTCFLLSLSAKAWGMTLPIVLLLLDVYPLRRPPSLREKAPYTVLALGAAALAFLAQERQPAMLTLGQHGPIDRVAQAAYGLAFYVWKTLLPLHLYPAYLLEGRLDPTASRYVLSFLVVASVTAVVLLRARREPWAAVAWVSYGLIVSPVLGFVQTGPQIAADRYTYLACLPFAALAGAVVYRASARHAPTTWAVAATVLGLSGVLTFRQTGIWHDSRTLWDHTLALDPANWIAYTNRGVTRQAAGDVDGALADYDRALRYNPGYAEALNDRGIVRYLRGDVEGAIADYDAAIRVRPGYADAYENRGLARHAKGEVDGAMADYAAAIALRPAYARAYYSRANLRLATGNADGAVADYTAAIDADPRYAEAYNNRAAARRSRGDLEGALADYGHALALVPPDGPDAAMIRRNLDGVRAERTNRDGPSALPDPDR
jgi:protein O-mannosyl-transferase